MKITHAAFMLAFLFQGCATPHMEQTGDWYGPYPEITLLSENDSKTVVFKDGIHIPYNLGKEDLDAVVNIISRLPDDVLLGTRREVVEVWSGVPDQTVAIQIQLGYDMMLVFIQHLKSEWKLVGLYTYNI